MQSRVLTGVWLLVSWCGIAAGAVKVGDKPQLRFDAADGTHVSLEALRGKIVIVDFWATWCGPCMAEADHMVQIHKTYGPKGLQMLGISLDRDKTGMMQVAARSGFDWPHYFDGKVWDNLVAREWGVDGIPCTFLIGPDGDVLWTGHAALLDAALEDAFKNHPPQLVDPKVLADATALLDKAEAAVTANDQKAALAFAAKIPPAARADGGVADRMDKLAKQLDDAVSTALGEVETMIQNKEYVQAAARLKEFSSLSAVPSAKKAATRLKVLQAMPEAKSQLDAAEKAERDKARAEKSATALAAARKLLDDKDIEQAYKAFKNITISFPGTPGAAEAADEVKKLEADTALMQRINGAANEAKAKLALNLGDSYKAAGRNDIAREKYQSVIDQFPNTPWAETARKAIETLRPE